MAKLNDLGMGEFSWCVFPVHFALSCFSTDNVFDDNMLCILLILRRCLCRIETNNSLSQLIWAALL